MSERQLDDLEDSIRAISEAPIFQRGEAAERSARSLMLVLHDFERRLSQSEGSTCETSTEGEPSP